MSDLLSSRWAPGAHASPPQAPPPPAHRRRPRSENRIRTGLSPIRTTTTSTTTTLLPPAEELARFMKIIARLRWKLPFLAEAYRLASTADPTAELMFKLDFHEYYALLERALVHLLAVFNVTVSGRDSTRSGLHRYHANVLAALAEERTPLAPVLGNGPVLGCLQQAKELRNRWKTAGMTEREKEMDVIGERGEARPLASYDFDGILSGIFAGLEGAYARAREHVELCRKPGEEGEDIHAIGREEADWEFMVDAMDWEAV
ncbi:hypothetical protein N7462_000739 [Penicillium macrosclerotiorum]|uniref:uncharacterized protein n=1 Tax=Penicillium macrosclerotiorum TaxID=303699 RepID=UPI00254910CE|nr:uncharacterized protein N7462_000739 [Penicillium macrosclerotiorum]KAJ5698734.1 hypothetical protein N7462_000739 [Penicillium macrosclerotiorum]